MIIVKASGPDLGQPLNEAIFLGQPFLLLGPPFFPVILFLSTTQLTKMTGSSLHMQMALTTQSHGSFLKENNWFFITDQTPRPSLIE
jgi:hypothetical protein